MGIEKIRVEEHPQFEELICAICQEIFDVDTTSGMDCEHCFCTTCINKWLERKNTCPTCNSQFIPKETHRFLRIAIKQLKVKCKFCMTITKYENLNQHEENCNGRICMIRDGCKMRMIINHNSIEGCVQNLKACLQHANQLENCSTKICQQKCIFLKEKISETNAIAAEEGQSENVLPKIRKQEYLNNLKLHVCRMIYAIIYKEDVELKQRNLKVEIETEDHRIKYEGFHEEIEEATQKAIDVFKKIKCCQFMCEPIQQEFIIKYEQELTAWLRTNNFDCVIDFRDDRKDCFYIYSMTLDEIQRCYDKLCNHVVTRKYVLDDGLKLKFNHFLELEEARRKWNDENSSYIYSQDDKAFTICGFKETINEVIKRIDFIIKN